MNIITVSNIKGGVAKTTTAATLAAGLNSKGYKVLMIDADPQTNLTMCFLPEPSDDDLTMYHVFKGTCEIKEAITTLREGLDIALGDFELCSADLEFFHMVGSLNKLEKAIKPIKDNYDFIIIDTPPNLGFLSMNAFMISNFVLTPMAADSFSLKAVRLLAKTLAQFKDDINKDIPVIGILLTKYSFNTNIAKILEDSINKSAELLNTKPFESRIRNSVKVLESQLLKTDLLTYAPRATASEDYSNFIDEFLERIESWA